LPQPEGRRHLIEAAQLARFAQPLCPHIRGIERPYA